MDTGWIWLQFLMCVLAILLSGLWLAHYGQLIAAHTGVSRGWVGLVLVATVTSLPELVTGVGAVTVAASPDLAVGNVLGSCVFNLCMIGAVELLYRRRSMLAQADASHRVAASAAMVMLAVLACGLWLAEQGWLPSWGSVSVLSVVLTLLYVLALRSSYFAQTPEIATSVAQPSVATASTSVRSMWLGGGLASTVIVGAGLWLPVVSLDLAQAMGWSDTLVGTLLMAAATTAPEMAATLGAIRLRAVDMVLGNLLGSNLFDLMILSIDDLAYVQAPLYAQVSNMHQQTVLFVLCMTAVVGWALSVRAGGKAAGTALVALFALHVLLQFQLGT